MRLKVTALSKLPLNKKMILSGVSTKKSEKETKRLLVEANGWIRWLETFARHGLQSRCKEMQHQPTEAVKSGWEYIYQVIGQDYCDAAPPGSDLEVGRAEFGEDGIEEGWQDPQIAAIAGYGGAY